MKQRRRRIRRRVRRIVRTGKPVHSPSEDSLSRGVAKALANAGWEYRQGAWRPGFLPGTRLGTKRAKEPHHA